LREPVHSNPPGLFFRFNEDEAMALLESEGHVKREEIAVLPLRVYATAKANGPVREDPVHLVVTTGTGRKPTDSAMTVTNTEPGVTPRARRMRCAQ
jgi:hypothetical protein